MFIIFQKEGPCLLKWCLTFRASWRRYTFAACYIIYIYIHVSESLNHGRPPSSNLHGVLYKEIQQKNSHLQFQERMRRSTELLQLFSQAVESTRVMQQATQEWSLCFIAGRTTHTHTLCTLYKQQSPIKYKSREPTWNSKTSKDWMIRISFSKTVWGWDVSFPVYTPHLKHLIPWFLGTRLCYSKPFWEMQWVYYESICTAEEESVEMCR